MGTITLLIPQVGQPNSSEDPKVASDMTTIQAAIDGGIDLTNLSTALQAIVPGAWQTWTPTVSTTGGVQPTIGNGTLAGAFQTFNKTCIHVLTMTVGSTTVNGTGYYSFGLPNSAVQSAFAAGSALLYTAATGQYWQGIAVPTASTLRAYFPQSATQNPIQILANCDNSAAAGTGVPALPGQYSLQSGSTLSITAVYQTT